MSWEDDITDVNVWREIARRNEDAAFQNFGAVIKLVAQVEALAAQLDEGRRSRTSAATRARSDASDALAALARQRRAEGKSVVVIAEELGRTERQVRNLLKRPVR